MSYASERCVNLNFVAAKRPGMGYERYGLRGGSTVKKIFY